MKYVLGVLGVVLASILIFVLFFTGGNDKPSTQSDIKVSKLVDYADKNATVSVTTVGKLVGQEDRRSVRISVSSNERRFEILSGYDEQVVSSQTFSNSQEAYTNFLSALSAQGFTSSRKSAVDPRGACPTGNRYIYDLSQDGDHVSNLWQASCDGQGTFNGRGATIRQLFQQQIPDYAKLIQTVKL